MNKKMYKKFNNFILFASLGFPIVAFIIAPSTNSIIGNIDLIGEIFVFLIYMIPTIIFILAITELKKSDYKKSKFKVSDFTSIKFEYMRVVFSLVIGVYFLLNSVYYIAIPIILISLDVLIIIILNVMYCNKLIFCPWDKLNKVSLEKLNKYNKYNRFGTSLTEAILFGIGVISFTSMPLDYFNVLGFNSISLCSYAISLLVYFMTTTAYKQILDSKYNDFVEYRGRCVDYGTSGKGAGGYHTFYVLNTDEQFVYIASETPIFRNGQVITLIIGMRSNKVINY